jgi:hypothetical protein
MAGGLGGNLFYIPRFVKAAGLDPNNPPATWNQLWADVKKTTKWDSKGNLVRITVPVLTPSMGAIDQFCGRANVTYDATPGGHFHANLPCIQAFFTYEKRLLDYYGGLTKYNKFITADPGIWNGYTPKAYITTGKIVFDNNTGFWEGQQLDLYWKEDWRTSPPTLPTGALKEWQAIGSTGQMVAIPLHAKNPRLAWDFSKFTLFQNDMYLGPTTNTYNVASHAKAWGVVISQNEAKVRDQRHIPGPNPMVAAAQMVLKMGRYAQGMPSTDVAASFFNDYLQQAWQEVEYNQASISQALTRAQQLIDAKQAALHAQFGIK